MKIILFALLVMFISNGLLAQETIEKSEIGSISTDRPIQSETPFTVPKKHLQFEMGLNYELGLNNFVNIITGPNLLIKYGLTDRLELRMSNNYINSEVIVEDIDPIWGSVDTDTITTAGVDAPLFGLKYKLIGAKGGNTNMVASLSSKVNAWGSENFKSHNNNLLGRLTLGQSFTDSWYGIVGFEYGAYFEANGSYNEIFYVIQTGYSFSFNLTAIIEYYAYAYPGITQHAINGALVYLISDQHQVDLSGGGGLGDRFYSHYFSVGYSFRIGL